MVRGSIKCGDRFSAIIRKSVHSRTLAGQEKAGKYCGTFIATGITKAGWVESGERVFRPELWTLKKIEI